MLIFYTKFLTFLYVMKFRIVIPYRVFDKILYLGDDYGILFLHQFLIRWLQIKNIGEVPPDSAVGLNTMLLYLF